jgi:hypothetical protein
MYGLHPAGASRFEATFERVEMGVSAAGHWFASLDRDARRPSGLLS